MNLEEIQNRWQAEPDEYLLKAAEKDIAEYPIEVQGIILAEAKRRNFQDQSVCEEILTRKAQRRKYNLMRAGVILAGFFGMMVGRLILEIFIQGHSYMKNSASILLTIIVCGVLWPSKKEI